MIFKMFYSCLDITIFSLDVNGPLLRPPPSPYIMFSRTIVKVSVIYTNNNTNTNTKVTHICILFYNLTCEFMYSTNIQLIWSYFDKIWFI